MWDGKLSEGSAMLLHQGRSDVGRGSVLQVITTKPIQQLSGTRVRVVLSDGKQKISAVLASQVCAKVQHVNLDGAIVRINEFQLNGLNAYDAAFLRATTLTCLLGLPLRHRKSCSSPTWTFSPISGPSLAIPSNLLPLLQALLLPRWQSSSPLTRRLLPRP